ncbi:siderophore-iron reductase FhuF [Vibrio sp. D404a]|uniref:siderophore-iron reductase FhuF n=1 Tax=unclassified Vibrio TaxID=2614977 RepID=UPI002553E563|nr:MULTISPECIES: siderophore-iron reductase FhuF [unclassified Vibrio]MDK9735669.1 siderophore-iron reductase FhuF [Vibrio sp. D404a]MDK9798585.1 siderophore-iron reductase FhuF [Vibrio sp. D449a]
MKIKSIQAAPLKVVSSGFTTTDFNHLQSLWGERKHYSLELALNELMQVDQRHELKVLSDENIDLNTWLNESFAQLMSLHAEHTQLGTAVCASLWHKQLVELIFPTLVALRWKYGIVPETDAKAIHLNIEPNGRINTIALENQDSRALSDLALDKKLAEVVANIGAQLEPIFAEQRVNRKRFWGNLSNALAQGFTRLSDHRKNGLSHDQSETVEKWLFSILGEKNSLVEIKSTSNQSGYALFARRKTCCLKYKLDKVRMCKTCSLMAIEEQQQFYESKYALKSA